MSTAAVETSVLPTVPLHAVPAAHTRTSGNYGRIKGFERSASYSTLPGVGIDEPSIKRNLSEQNLGLAQNSADISASVQNANLELFKKASTKTKNRMSVAGFVRPNDAQKVTKAEQSAQDKSDGLSIKSLGRGAGLKLFSKRPWGSSPNVTTISQSKPPQVKKQPSSPARLQDLSVDGITKSIAIPEPVAGRKTSRPSYGGESTHSSAKRKDLSPSSASRYTSSSNDTDNEPTSRKPSRQSSISSLRSRASTDRMYLSVPGQKVPPVPSSMSSDHSSGVGYDSCKMKDPFWTQFRTADGEYMNFAAKTTVQKAKVIRGMLLSFLSKTSDRVTAFSLRPEDLDRRVVILNKWWTTILDLLLSNTHQALAGSDRPVFLEALCELMQRPEWKIPPHQPLAVNIAANTVSDAANEIDDTDYLLRSIHHNIRNMFVHNLVRQMTYVVEKLSQRAAPASLVVFGGKTCAHAFLFCPGVADMLTRLWKIPAGTLRRIFAEYGPDAGSKASSTSQALATSFPVALRSLCFKSHMTLARHLQNQAQVPPNTTEIRWHGPWVNRWTGRDSDLFFVFVKYYHILVAEHLPRKLRSEERLGIPGLVVVHAQLLLNLEAALYRQAGQHALDHHSSATDNPDTIAPLPNFVANATRSIGDNRLVMLLRDSMSDSLAGSPTVSELLVGSFQNILKAAVRKIPMFNSDACFVLCDFLEELMPIVSRYQERQPEDEDWDFWFKVYQQLLLSESTMTQIRAIAFLYATWPILVKDEERRREIVLGWLLQDDTFTRFFNHWSPMVRHYFFRLLCWRIGRCDGTASETDLDTFQRLSELLDRRWAHHAYLTADAEMRKKAAPSGNACAPAPGRVLLIIKSEGRDASDSFTSFDKLSTLASQSSPYLNQSSVMAKVPPADPTPPMNMKKKWGTGILKSINPFSGPANMKPGEVTPPQSPNSVPSDPMSKYKPDARPATPPHHALSFRFSLEYTHARPQLPVKGRKLPPPQIPHTSQKLLDDLDKLERLSSGSKTSTREINPVKPQPHELQSARYSGRALSEWAQVVQECRSFYVRRKQEGCPKDAFVETPNIAVESFRMFG